MSSEIDICNNALAVLGETLIASLTEDNKAARLCNLQYAPTRDTIFRSYPWHCLQKRALLARSFTDPLWGYNYQYALPSDCLKVLELEEHNDNTTVEYSVEGRFILTDAETCTILYISRVTDPNEMDVMLRDVISSKMAADMAYNLTGNPAMVEMTYKLYKVAMAQARSVDAQEGTPRLIVENSWYDERE